MRIAEEDAPEGDDGLAVRCIAMLVDRTVETLETAARTPAETYTGRGPAVN
jgi:hypothetical protein